MHTKAGVALGRVADGEVEDCDGGDEEEVALDLGIGIRVVGLRDGSIVSEMRSCG